MNPVTIDDQSYLCPSWKDMGEITINLAKKIKNSNTKYDRVLALARGGLSWNRQLQDLLNIKHTSSIQVRFYKGINDTAKKPIVIQSLPVTIENEDILIFDDIADTGDSLIMAKNYLDAHGANSIHSATLFEKPWSKIKPEYSAEITESWVIFPHDAIENIKLLKEKWGNISSEDFRQRLLDIGLEQSIVDFYLASDESA